MAYWETIFYWITLVAYALAAGGCIYSFVFKNPRVMPKITLLVAGWFPCPHGGDLSPVLPQRGISPGRVITSMP